MAINFCYILFFSSFFYQQWILVKTSFLSILKLLAYIEIVMHVSGLKIQVQSVQRVRDNLEPGTRKILQDFVASIFFYNKNPLYWGVSSRDYILVLALLLNIHHFVWYVVKIKWNYFSSLNHNFIVLCELLMPYQLFAQKCSYCQEITKISKCLGSPRTLCHW